MLNIMRITFVVIERAMKFHYNIVMISFTDLNSIGRHLFGQGEKFLITAFTKRVSRLLNE